MPTRVYIKDIAGYVGKEVAIRGWLYNRRSSGKLHFLQVRDGTEVIQCVMFKGDVSEEEFELGDKLPYESSLIVEGLAREEKRSPLGYEISVKKLTVIQQASPDYPISLKEHGVGFLMDNRHLWIRTPRQTAILKIRHTLIKAIRDYFDENGFTLVDTPIFTPAACEGTSTLFSTEYFGQMAYLTQSGQLYNEAAIFAVGKTYCFGPTFRAEKSKTRRHLTEFWMVEPEVAFLTHDENLDLCEDFLVAIIARVLDKHLKELQTLLERDTKVLENVKKPFPRLRYTEAIEKLKTLGSDIKWGDDFGGDDETILTQQFDRPIIVDRYPAEVKAFYMKRDPKDPNLALCVDVLAPEGYGEIIGGGTREENAETLLESINKHNLPVEAFDWYLDLRKYGSVPHAGFGLGVERTLAWICGLKHVRETIPFPRLMDRIKP
ncbi:MAG: asparagine--tRNA ligase [Myxococcota bacterium]